MVVAPKAIIGTGGMGWISSFFGAINGNRDAGNTTDITMAVPGCAWLLWSVSDHQRMVLNAQTNKSDGRDWIGNL